MSIEMTRCWYVTGLPDDETYGSPCWPDAGNASSYAAEIRADGHEGVGHTRRDQDCLWAECDGCDVPLEGDDALVHAPDRATLDGLLAGEGWIVATDGRVLCPDCKDHPVRGGRPADPVALPGPGDVPLFDLEVTR